MMRLAVLCDYLEEGWISMNLVADRLLERIDREHAGSVQAARVRPAMIRRFTRLPLLGGAKTARNADRFLNRFYDYPRHLAPRVPEFDLFHICDHSYAQLAHSLPRGRIGVFCHDIDAFRCLVEPSRERRSWPFKRMARHILTGLQKASVVFHSTRAVREQLESHGLVDPKLLVHAPYGVSPVFAPEDPDGADLTRLQRLGLGDRPYLLHVGSCNPRKRIDTLLAAFGEARARRRDLRLLQVGGRWTTQQEALIGKLGIGPSVLQVRGVSLESLASIYRSAALMLLTSEAEGFGLPLAEALACGRIVIASDIPAFREVGGDAAVYCPVGDAPAWAAVVDRLLGDASLAPSLRARLGRVAQLSWSSHARTVVEAYGRILR